MTKRTAYIAFLIALNVTLNSTLGQQQVSASNLVSANQVNSVSEVNNTSVNTMTMKSESINLSQEDLIKDFRKTLNNNDVVYKHLDAYIPKTAIDQMLSKLDYHENFATTNTLSSEEILEKIINSSKKFKSKDYTSIFETEDGKTAQEVLKIVLDDIVNNGTNDINEDLYLLQNLRVIEVPYAFAEQYLNTETNGIYYNAEKNTIIIHHDSMFYDPVTTKNLEVGSLEYKQVLAKNLVHAINDLRQTKINKKESNNMNYADGFNNTLMEDASASYAKVFEKYNINEEKQSITDSRKNVLLLSMFNKDATPEKYYNALFDEDTKKVFEILNLKTKEDVYDFYKVLFSLDAKDYNNNFFDYYAMTPDINKEDMVDSIGYSYKLTLYNHYVNNLLDYMEKNGMSLEENLSMYLIGYNILTADIYYTTDYEGTVDYNSIYVVDTLKENKDKYLEFIKSYYKVNPEIVDNLLNSKIKENISNLNNESYLKQKYPMINIYNANLIPTQSFQMLDELEQESVKKI